MMPNGDIEDPKSYSQALNEPFANTTVFVHAFVCVTLFGQLAIPHVVIGPTPSSSGNTVVIGSEALDSCIVKQNA